MATKEFLIQAMQWSHSEPYMLVPSLSFLVLKDDEVFRPLYFPFPPHTSLIFIIQLEVNFTLLLNKELQNVGRDHLEVFKQF